MTKYRPAAIAGMFYPEAANEIDLQMGKFLVTNHKKPVPKAAIVPHAGWVYSGECAGKVYSYFIGRSQHIKKVLLFGPAHRIGFQGTGLCSADVWQTPDGGMRCDFKLAQEIVTHYKSAQFIDVAHAHEHCLEVQVPFIKRCFPYAQLVPILVSGDGFQSAKEIMQNYIGKEGVVVLISSDLSHYNPPDHCRSFDDATASIIENLEYDKLDGKRACGYKAIQALLHIVKEREYTIEREHLCHSGDAKPGSDKVVGYGAWTIQ